MSDKKMEAHVKKLINDSTASKESVQIRVDPNTHAILKRMKALYEKNSLDETVKKALVLLIDKSIIELSQTGEETLIRELCQLRRALMPKLS